MNAVQVIVLAGLSCLVIACGGGGGGGGGAGEKGVDDSPTNLTPTIKMAAEISVEEKSFVNISADNSDADGHIVSFQWEQVSGPTVSISSATIFGLSFDVPDYDQGASLTFRLIIIDNGGLSTSREVRVNVVPKFMSVGLLADYGAAHEILQDSSDYLAFTTKSGGEYRIVLRSEIGDADLAVYSNSSLEQRFLLGASANADDENDTLKLNLAGQTRYYVKVTANEETHYSLRINQVDPYLEPGFPVETYTVAGQYDPGAVVVGNIDEDPRAEILATGFSYGPLYAWHHDGTLVDGWPENRGQSAAYPSLGNFTGTAETLEIAAGYGLFAASCNADKFIFTGAADVLPGWPVEGCLAGSGTPSLVDINGDSIDELVFGREIYQAGGQVIYPWTSSHLIAGSLYVIDFENDGRYEFVFDESLTRDDAIEVFNSSGRMLPGYPAAFSDGSVNSIPGGLFFGDVNGDGKKEIIRLSKYQIFPFFTKVDVLSSDGRLLWTRDTQDSVSYLNSPSLADLNGDSIPEIIVQTDQSIYVWSGNGDLYPGWPVQYTSQTEDTYSNTKSTPLIADVDGDQAPDIVVSTYSRVLVYSSDGQKNFTLRVTSITRTPAIADIDLDGRNEIIVGSDLWQGYEEAVDTIWVFDLGGENHGPVLWGQAGGAGRHTSTYPTRQ